ncbi:hypothetical protein [uncultured Modestobacter sp.]|uniref:hypothetical protein n=1 Tax=uncultured Modestobacter sp. TaxID=380048 RepID=UPI002620733E|nr:hypothetical protein [uncultured Modestobacter sp.]
MTPHISQGSGIWAAGSQPWVRQVAPSGYSASAAHGRGVRCYFCGHDTAKISGADVQSDTGRVEVYCDNTDCDARTVTILVEKDGARAAQRADVRALQVIDSAGPVGTSNPSGPTTQAPPPSTQGSTTVARRTNRDPLQLTVP